MSTIFMPFPGSCLFLLLDARDEKSFATSYLIGGACKVVKIAMES